MTSYSGGPARPSPSEKVWQRERGTVLSMWRFPNEYTLYGTPVINFLFSCAAANASGAFIPLLRREKKRTNILYFTNQDSDAT